MQRRRVPQKIKNTARQRYQNRLQIQQQDQDQYQKKTQTDLENEQFIIFFPSFRSSEMTEEWKPEHFNSLVG
jgi:hypothetical protein